MHLWLVALQATTIALRAILKKAGAWGLVFLAAGHNLLWLLKMFAQLEKLLEAREPTGTHWPRFHPLWRRGSFRTRRAVENSVN